MNALVSEARELNHPDPENARPGEVNILSVASMYAGRRPSPEEAQAILDRAERESDLNDTLYGSNWRY